MILPNTFDLWPRPFPDKIIPNIAKSNRIFPGKGRGDKEFIWHIWITQWVKTPYCLFFSILAIFRRKIGVKVSPKVLTLGPSLFHKYLNPSENFRTVFLLVRVLSLVRISAIFDRYTDETYHDYVSSWECKPKSSLSQKFIFWA